MARTAASRIALTAAVVAALVVTQETRAWAEGVTFHYEVRITSVTDWGGHLSDRGIDVRVGDVIHGQYTFDSDAPDTSPGVDGVGAYFSPGAAHFRRVTLDGVTLDVPGTRVEIQNDRYWWPSGFSDRYFVTGSPALSGGMSPTSLQIEINLQSFGTTYPHDGGVGSDVLPVVPPGLTPFSTRRFSLRFDRPYSGSLFAWSEVVGVVTRIHLSVQPVTIDVKPGSGDNPVNLKAKGTLPVALLGSEELDVRDVDVSTLDLAGAGVAEKTQGDLHYAVEDVDEDGYDDLLLHFPIQDLDLKAGDTEAELTGELLDGTRIAGSDRVVVKS